jgi:hypothetical protein
LKQSSLPRNKVNHFAALKTYKILDVYPKHFFDDFTQLAAQICGTPIANISFIDENHV